MLKPTYNSYAVNNWLFAGEYPGDRDERKAQEKLDKFIEFGITHFIDLTTEGELYPYAQLLPKRGVGHIRFPIVDQNVPNSFKDVWQLINGIKQIHADFPNAKIYIHCWGGVGRTGTIVGCFLANESGDDYETTIWKLRCLWNGCPKSERRISTPEYGIQFNFIRKYIEYIKKINKRYTPERINFLAENEIFVFGSNLCGFHGSGAARMAYERFGAVWGKGVGLQGQSYAIPTMQGGVETIKPYVDAFIQFAKKNSQLTFLVTRIGCGIAGFRDDEIAPLFKEALNIDNVILPKEFEEYLEEY